MTYGLQTDLLTVKSARKLKTMKRIVERRTLRIILRGRKINMIIRDRTGVSGILEWAEK